MRSLALVAVLIPVAANACDQVSATGAPSAPIADQRSVELEASLADSDRIAVRTTAVAMVHPEGLAALPKGLEELAQAEPASHAYRVERMPDRAWFAKGGLGHWQAGNGNKSAARIDGFVKRLDQERLDGAADLAYLELDPRDFPEGRTAEVVYTQYTTTMTINLTSAQLAGSFTETLQAPRVITTGNGSFITGPFNYPIELPNVSVDHLSTTLSAPSGGHFGDDTVLVPHLSERDPRVAFGKYTDTLATVAKAHSSMGMIYGTVPLGPKGNWQRNWYNQAVRAYCAQQGKPLFDAAAILSHGPDGAMAHDEQGERIAAAYVDPATGGVNKAGRERLARAWWWLVATLKKPATPATTAPASTP